MTGKTLVNVSAVDERSLKACLETFLGRQSSPASPGD